VSDRGEPLPCGIELADDHSLDIGVQRGVRARDELVQGQHQRAVLAASLASFGPVVWMMLTALSVRSEALITGPTGWRPGWLMSLPARPQWEIR
jgi:hypothetical protein